MGNNEDKKEKTESNERPRGERGEVGTATTSDAIKHLWRETHFKRVDANDRFNPRKKLWVPNRDCPSLKDFARSLLADETNGKLAKDWLAHKHGSLNKSRSEKNVARISLEKQATKAAKRKRSQGNKGGKAAS